MSISFYSNSKTNYVSPMYYKTSKEIIVSNSHFSYDDNFDILPSLKNYLKEKMKKNKNQEKIFLNRNIFYMEEIPKIIIEEYIEKILFKLNPENSTIILSLIFLDKICINENNKISLIKNNVYKLFLAALIVAIKYNEDLSFKNSYVAKSVCIYPSELNELVLEFLIKLDFNLYVTRDLYDVYRYNLKKF